MNSMKQNEETVEIYPTAFIQTDIVVIDNKKLRIIEISGNVNVLLIQPRYRKYWQMFYDEVKGIVFVIDGADVKRLNIVKELVDNLENQLGKKIPIAFLVNKTDIPGSLNKSELKKFFGLDKLESNFIWTMK